MASPGITQALTATFKEVSADIHDDVINNNALLSKIEVKPVTGGVTIRHPIFYAENDSFQWYNGWEELDTSRNDIMTAAEYEYKQCSVNIQMSGLEEIQNAGKPQLIELLQSKIQNATSTMRNRMNLAIYSDGTGSGGKEIGGLQLLISDTPSVGTVGGINAATWSFWRNIAFDATTDGGAAATSANIEGYMDAVDVQICRYSDGSDWDMIVTDNNYFNLYRGGLKARQQITSTTGDSIHRGVMYDGREVVLDGGVGGACPANHMYFINTKHLMLRNSTVRNMENVGGERMATKQDGYISFTFWAGNLTCGSRKLQAVLKD